MTTDRHVRLPDDLAEAVRDYAAQYGLSEAAAIRFLLVRALKEEGQS